MIFVMALIGAVTRLTESGLSIVEWAPISGTLPPLSRADWQRAFEGYQQIPQYHILHSTMTLEEFKTIYFWEWLHRLWGRLIGLVYAGPFFWFLARRRIPPGLHRKLWLGLILGSLQGLVGWFMVVSGLSAHIYVSHLRLALHLLLALTIYAYLFWLTLDLAMPYPGGTVRQARRRWLGWLCLGMIATTMIWGAFVAGLKAGWVYNSFPLMDGVWLPEAAWSLEPWTLNFFNNTALVQFCHRWLAFGTATTIWLWCWSLWPTHVARRPLLALIGMVGIQILLGISTLLTHVNIVLATCHQAGAIITLSLLIYQLHRGRLPTSLAHSGHEA